jgi:hypothetical protein
MQTPVPRPCFNVGFGPLVHCKFDIIDIHQGRDFRSRYDIRGLSASSTATWSRIDRKFISLASENTTRLSCNAGNTCIPYIGIRNMVTYTMPRITPDQFRVRVRRAFGLHDSIVAVLDNIKGMHSTHVSTLRKRYLQSIKLIFEQRLV